MTDLAERLEQAEAGSRELSDAVLLALGWDDSGWPSGPWYSPKGTSFGASGPDPTRSVDDGLALLREMGCGLHARIATRNSHMLILEPLPEHIETAHLRKTVPRLDGTAATPALALSAALVRAHAAKEGGDG